MTSGQQILASFIGTLFGFIFAIVLFLITNYIQRKVAKKTLKKYLNREFQYNISLLQDWMDTIDEILRKITAKDKQIYKYVKYSDFARYFMDESFKFGIIFDLFSNEDVFKLNKVVTYCNFALEQFINARVTKWNNCPIAEEDKLQKELLNFFEYEKTKLKDFKKNLEKSLEKIK